MLRPPIHVHCMVVGLNSHRSFSAPKFPLASLPSPPKSQKLPLPSVQVAAPSRPPGMLLGAGVLTSRTRRPADGILTELLPPIQVDSFGAVVCASADKTMPANAATHTKKMAGAYDTFYSQRDHPLVADFA